MKAISVKLSAGMLVLAALHAACGSGEVSTTGGGGGSGGTCTVGQEQCGGACVRTDIDPLHCGACDNGCKEGQVCSSGECAFGCSGGTTKCGGGCVDLELDKQHCGACAEACPEGQVCSGGTCGLECSGGAEKCGEACVDVSLDPAHCGACDAACAEGEVCSQGQCGLECLGGATKCGEACVDTDLDPAHCGACDAACAEGEVCSLGTCSLSCAGGTEKCGGSCVDTLVDPKNCGSCGTACTKDDVCAAGVCALKCSGGTVECSGKCVDTQTDSQNCGACATVCKPGEVCSQGQCTLSCAGGTTKCGSACVDLQNDPKNCGSCGTACAQAEVCNAGACTLQCSGGSTKCGSVCVDLQNDPKNCGACGTACAQGEVCSAGACTKVCAPGMTACGQTCVDTAADPNHCGGCGQACGQSETCSGGACAAPPSCHALKQQKPALPDGAYTLDPDGPGGQAPLSLYCDMTTDGGGWTLVYKTDQSSTNERTDAGYNQAALASAAIDAVAVLPRATVALLGNAYRIRTANGTRKLYWTGAPFYTTDNHVGKIYSPYGKLTWTGTWASTHYQLNPAHGICVGIGGTSDWNGLEHMCTQRWCCGSPNAGIWFNFGSFNPGAVHPGSAWTTTIATSGSDGKTQLTAGSSCRQIRDDGHSVGDGSYWVDLDGGDKGNALQVYCDMGFQGGGWMLVRRQKPGVAWQDTPNDNLAGSSGYGSYAPNPKAAASFGLAFNKVAFSQFLFRTGDGVKWLIADSSQIYFGWNNTCGPGNAVVTKSHVQGQSYGVGWCKRTGNPEDPWISAQDHGFGGASCGNDNDTHSMLYGESYGCWGYYTNNRDGVNVLVR